MNTLDVISVDIIAAKDNATVVEIATRLVLSAFNGGHCLDKEQQGLLLKSNAI